MAEQQKYDWVLGFAGPNLHPYIRLDCPNCGSTYWWEVTGSGHEPTGACRCAPPYPKGAAYQEHLRARPKRNEVQLAERNGQTVVLRATQPSVIITKRHRISMGKKK